MKGSKASANCREGQASFFLCLFETHKKTECFDDASLFKRYEKNRKDYIKNWFCSIPYFHALSMEVYGKLILF